MFYFRKIIIPSILLLPAYGTDVPGTINSSKWFFFLSLSQKLGVTFLRRLQIPSPHLWLLLSLIVAGIFGSFLPFVGAGVLKFTEKSHLLPPPYFPSILTPLEVLGLRCLQTLLHSLFQGCAVTAYAAITNCRAPHCFETQSSVCR